MARFSTAKGIFEGLHICGINTFEVGKDETEQRK